jgi:pimeloyl-ACP methyl ester carboxylesterase
MQRTFFLLTLFFVFTANAIAAEPNIYRGKLGQSQILIAAPANYGKKMVVLAHGLRSETMPITADINLQEPFYKKLLDEGWLIASTSYRRNGPIIDDAIEDLLQVRDFAINKYGKPKKMYLMGISMGGAIGARISETCTGKFDGILCIGAALYLYPNLSGHPAIPMLFLSNRSEAQGPRDYIDRLQENSVRPALWIVGRDGHCNVNDKEMLAAFRAVVAYAEKGEIAFNRALTIAQAPVPSTAVFKDGGASAPIEEINPIYGNLHTRFVPADFKKLRINKGDIFTVRFNNKDYKVLLGTAYADVPTGGLVAFFTHNGKLHIARNEMNAAEMLGCTAGDMLFIVFRKPSP